MSRPFVHLHVHSEFSLVDSVLRLPALVETAAEAGMPAVALTDQSNLFAAVKFQKAAMDAGVQPILGVDLLVDEPDDTETPSRLVLLVQDATGYLNLTRLVTRSFTEGQHRGEPRIRREWLDQRRIDRPVAGRATSVARCWAVTRSVPRRPRGPGSGRSRAAITSN